MLIEKQKLLEIYQTLPTPILDGDGYTRKHGEPMQDPEELYTLIQRLDANSPLNTIIELGVCQGGGLKVWEQILPQNKQSLLIGVDWGPNILWDYANSPVDIRIVKGDTHAQDTWQAVKQILHERGDRKADFMFIDAQHWPKDVEQDFTDYGGFVRDNGIIGFHDTRLMRSFWDRFTGAMVDSGDKYLTDPDQNRSEHAVFHKEEIKNSFGTGIFWKVPGQNVIKFKET
jgi:hypothetical protein